jgi:hypothetical protein
MRAIITLMFSGALTTGMCWSPEFAVSQNCWRSTKAIAEKRIGAQMIDWLTEFFTTTDGAWAIFWSTISALVLFVPNEILFPKVCDGWLDDADESV